MLNVQKFLIDNSLATLEREHGINFRFSTENPSKFSLNYDMIQTNVFDVYGMECRGLVLETPYRTVTPNMVVGETTVLASPMRRFHNIGQDHALFKNMAAPYHAYEKLDGTMCMVYFDHTLGQWCVATRSVPDADLSAGEFTFRELFWKSFQACGGNKDWLMTNPEAQCYTYIFELCTPENKVVIYYKEYKTVLLAVKDNKSGMEMPVEKFAQSLHVKTPNKMSFETMEEIVKFVNDQNGHEYEGVVVCDSAFNRIKVKNAQYCLRNKRLDLIPKTRRLALKFVLDGTDDDMLDIVPEHVKDWFNELRTNLIVLYRYMDSTYTSLREEFPERKHFAGQVFSNNMLFSGFLMARYSGKCHSFNEWVQSHKKNNEWSNNLLDELLSAMTKV